MRGGRLAGGGRRTFPFLQTQGNNVCRSGTLAAAFGRYGSENADTAICACGNGTIRKVFGGMDPRFASSRRWRVRSGESPGPAHAPDSRALASRTPPEQNRRSREAASRAPSTRELAGGDPSSRVLGKWLRFCKTPAQDKTFSNNPSTRELRSGNSGSRVLDRALQPRSRSESITNRTWTRACDRSGRALRAVIGLRERPDARATSALPAHEPQASRRPTRET